MNEQLSATIIPFPVRTRQAPAASTAVMANELAGGKTLSSLSRHEEVPELPHTLASSAQRLTYALKGLSIALADQRDATQRWKTALEDLATKMRTLGDTSKFRTNIGGSAEIGGSEITENAARQP